MILESFIGTLIANAVSFVILAIILKLMSDRIKKKADKVIEKKKQDALGDIFG